jgi:hypothetical protein
MTAGLPPELGAIVDVARATPGLEALFLFGSRARGDAAAGSDWDFGYLASGAFDEATLLGAIVIILGSDHVDLVNLRRAGGLLRFRAARDGQLLFETRRGLGDQFRLEAAQFWCEAAAVLRHGYDEVLAEFTR